MTQSDFIRELAAHTHFTLGDLMNRANVLRDAEMITRGGRGRSGLMIEADEAALIILAAMSGASANTCPDAVRKLPGDMPLMNADGSQYEEISITALTEDSVTVSVPKSGRALDVVSCIAEILDDPSRADLVKSFTLDYVNKRAVLSWKDGRKDVFGQFNEDGFNSGMITMLHGRVFQVLACAMLPEDERHRDPAYFEWVKQVVKIGNEHGDKGAQTWMKENPFKPVKE